MELAPLGESGSGPDFRDFFEAEYRRLAKALFLITGDPLEADELAQESMVRVFERWDRVSRMEAPVGYLYRTALNLHRSGLRRLASSARRVLRPSLATDPLGSVETRDEIARLLSGLPRGQREALVLVHWLGMDAQEAGGVLGIDPATVRVQVSRGRGALRKTQEMGDE